MAKRLFCKRSIMRKWLWNATWIILRPLLVIFCHFKINRADNLSNIKAPFIMAIGIHSTLVDGYLVGAACPFNCNFFPIRFMSKTKFIDTPILKIFLEPLLRTIIKIYGVFWVEPGKGVGVEKSLEYAEKLLKKGETVGIFPEGRLSKTGELQEGKKGAAHLSIKTNLPILPVALFGAYKLNMFNFLSRKKNIKVSFGELIYPDKLGYVYHSNPGISEEALDEFTKIIMQKIKEML